MKTVLYLIQAKAGLPEIYTCLRKRSILLLSYKKNTADTTIFAPNTTWTEGRNIQYNYVREKELLYDYYVFLDEDVVFQKPLVITEIYYSLCFQYSRLLKNNYTASQNFELLNQESGFRSLEESLELDYPVVTTQMSFNNPFIPPERKMALSIVAYFDPVLVGLSAEAFFSNTVLPYEEKYDSESWWISPIFFYKKANHFYPMQILSNNQYAIYNIQHSNYQGRSIDIAQADYKVEKELCKEFNIPAIVHNTYQAVNTSIPAQKSRIVWHKYLIEIIHMFFNVKFVIFLIKKLLNKIIKTIYA